ncbi:MAG TPA: MarC family protein [Rhabdochlamydiaceae bacterium]|jgi:multiple antibiotic resistance protein
MSIFALALSLFLVLNALGNVPVFVGLLSKYAEKKQRKIIMRELLIALFILLLFNFFGDEVLKWIGISQDTVGIAGGTLLLLIALGMIFPHSTDQVESHSHEPLIVPLATPIVAGPGAISTVMVYSEHVENAWIMLLVILLAWLPTFLILLASSHIKHFLGRRGLIACQKLGGMLISLIAVQMICTGAINLLKCAFEPALKQ